MAAPKQTYRILRPATDFRPATCAEADCDAWRLGWQTQVDESTELGQRQAFWIRKRSGRSFAESRFTGNITVFDFEPGQACFAASKHTTEVSQCPLFLVTDDLNAHRNTDNGMPFTRAHSSADSWGDDLHEHTAPMFDALRNR